MYSNRKSGFSVLDMLVKILFAALFIFILVWLFQKKVPNMKPFYNNVFRENIKYMQEAGEAYFTDDKMPKEIGQTVKITLSDMFDKKLVLPFVDEDGNSCNQYESYVSVTKELDESYSLKTNLVCNNQRDYTIKVLGCHNYCKTGDCNKICSIEKITSYQYKKLYKGTKTKYSCGTGYKLDGKYCVKTVLKDTVSAKVETLNTKKIVIDAIAKTTSSTKEELNVIKTAKRVYENKIISQELESYTCEKEEVKRTCSTSYVNSAYACNCTTHVGYNGKPSTTCSTCYSSVPVENCSNTIQKVQSTCTRNVTTYSCPKTAPIKEGNGSSLKCYNLVYDYSCPAESNYHVGTGKDLRCYKVKEGTVSYSCPDNSYKLEGNKCTKTVSEVNTEYKCSTGYKLEGTTCKKYETVKVKANSKKVNTSYYKYKWSTQTEIAGWTKTGKTKTVNGKEICK